MLGEQIIRARQAKGWSQAQLAEKLHVVRQTVSKWEQGRSVPDVQALVQLSQVLEVPLEELLGGPEPDRTPSAGETAQIAAQLARISEELAAKNRRNDQMWSWFSGGAHAAWSRICLVGRRLWWAIVLLVLAACVWDLIASFFGWNVGNSYVGM